MFEEYYIVTVTTSETDFKKEKRIAVLPRYGKEYWLGYYPHGSIWDSKSVHAFYMGHDCEEHIFINLRDHNNIEIYSCPVGGCFLKWYSEGDDDCGESAVSVNFKGLMSSGKEKDYAVQILKRKKAENKKSLEELAAIR